MGTSKRNVAHPLLSATQNARDALYGQPLGILEKDTLQNSFLLSWVNLSLRNTVMEYPELEGTHQEHQSSTPDPA